MNKTYDDWLDMAERYGNRLDQAITNNDSKNILYCRGKYLYALKQAHKLNPSGILPPMVTGRSSNIALTAEINQVARNHQAYINSQLQANKRRSDGKNPSITKELGLKIRRLSTRVKEVNMSTGTAKKSDIVKDAASLTGSVLKVPVLATTKVVSTVGPLAVTLLSLPVVMLASAAHISIDVYNGKTIDGPTYDKTVVYKMSNGLKKVVKGMSDSLHNTVARL